MDIAATTFDEFITPLTTVWQFDYDSNVTALRRLYEIAKRNQWNAAADISWDTETDPSQVGLLSPPGEDPLQRFDFYQQLSDTQRDELNRHRSAWILSQFLHAEQGATLCCGQLVEAVPDMDGKLFAATQVIDEARHVEVFHRYVQRLDHVYPILPGLKAMINAILTAEQWQMKCVGMQIIAESMLMGSFNMMESHTDDEVLAELLHKVKRDEVRHIGFGLAYLRQEVAEMSEPEQERLEDFAVAGIGILMAPQNRQRSEEHVIDILSEMGLDTVAADHQLTEGYSDPDYVSSLPNPIKKHAMPNLRRLGLINERTEPRFEQMGLLDP